VGIKKVQEKLGILVNDSFLLIFGTLIAFIFANVDYNSYHHLVEHVFLVVAILGPITLHFIVNDMLMCLFFGTATKEIVEAGLPGGPLHPDRNKPLVAGVMEKAGSTIMATIGGVVMPTILFLIGCIVLERPDLQCAWAVVCATDIAFSYLAGVWIFGKGLRITILLLLAILDDAIGLGNIAIFYPQRELELVDAVTGLSLIAPALWSALVFRVNKVRSFWPYILVSGSLSWLAFYLCGLHPALALVPVVPFMPSAKTDKGLFTKGEDLRHDTLNRFEHFFKIPIAFTLGLFGLVNAGVVFSIENINTAAMLVVLGLVVGKPLGIVSFAWISDKLFEYKLPKSMGPNGNVIEEITYKDMIVLGSVAGVGFTVALFVAASTHLTGPSLEGLKIGSLFSFFSMLVAYSLAKILGVKRLT